MIENPVLRGFNPDPSFLRVGDTYYMATSTFEWYPGVQIHQSTDLVNWELACRPLSRASQLDMRGNPDSGGIWAPCLSYADGLFWLVYTDVKRLHGNFKDTHNYIVTAPSIEGPWSDPIYVNSSGFDPSLFHDADGRKYFMNMRWNHIWELPGAHPAHPAFDGVLLQEWDPEKGLFGPVKNIFAGSDLGITEAPHIYKRNGYYYLTTAEGGTGYTHAVTLARSRDIWGPYDLHPKAHVVTAKDAPNHPLQRVGHGQIVETPDGQVYHSFLCTRPLPGQFSPMGRESCLVKCSWGDDDWLYTEDGDPRPPVFVAPPKPAKRMPEETVKRVFTDTLPPEFQWLRTPEPDRLFEMTGQSLRLIGRESMGSVFENALVARRQEHLSYWAECRLDQYDPDHYQQAAGLTTYYNGHKFYALLVTHCPQVGRCLRIMRSPGNWPSAELAPFCDPTAIAEGPIDLAVLVDHAQLSFFWRQDREWRQIGQDLDARILSDEAGIGESASFTGTFVGMVAFDVSGAAKPADFSSFTYRPGDA